MARDGDDSSEEESGAIQIQLWLEGTMPTGIAKGADGDSRDFTGWVGLMAAVDALAGTGSMTSGSKDTTPEEDHR
jgi:hypothetical protein